MSFASPISPFDSYGSTWKPKGEQRLAKRFFHIGQFLRGLRVQMRFGELTRAPLRLLRLQIAGDEVECDWLARPTDPWDADLSDAQRLRHSSLQALRDAIDVRSLLFDVMPGIDIAHLHIHRESPNFTQEMIITGCVQRNDNSSRNVHSLAMRAKVLGFRFDLQDDMLCRISSAEPLRVGERFSGRMVEQSWG